ncbi:hypothetical protein J7J56_01880 [candidate division WOR-3 bacterium]|nr:hypothetical protein [candidate division WOR-3 bacterium]
MGPIGRFQVMAVLQAARAYLLGLPIESAKSFGLNRAIFYAAAKRGFKKKGPPPELRLEKLRIPREKLDQIKRTFQIFQLGDEMSYMVEIEGRKYFVIGGEVQTEADFKRQVERRFGDKFDLVWQEALNICKQYDKGVLLSQRYFYETIYKPRRDELAKKWSALVTS